ncbi:hypothetical protein [Acinetobacter sp. Marseille-Q1618]|uniref:hypothetical protein n=1 Tax=Acinetobacter sp. Marseille-Q1618 TaxID=2697502 RepID=UPI00156F0DC5|nr:hypothetical protein [Acinetobacter sp. Marseille-Q1618]
MNKLFNLVLIGSLSISVNTHALQSEQQYFKMTQDLKGAYSVLTQQKSVSAQQQAQSAMSSNQALATAIGGIYMADRVLKFIVDDAGRLGSSQTTTCEVFSNQQAEKIQILKASMLARDMVSNFMKVNVSDKAEAELGMVERHKNYCTISEANMGLCAVVPNGIQTGDTNYALIFNNSKFQNDTFNAATDYIANLVDKRFSTQDICSKPECMAKQINYINTNSSNSLAAYVLSNQVTQRTPLTLLGGE